MVSNVDLLMGSYVQADRKVTPCAFLPWVDRVGGRPPDGRRPVVRRPTDGRRTVVRPDVRAARVSSAAPKKRSFDRGGPVWPPRSNVTNDRLGGVWGGFAPPAQNWGVWGVAPPSQKIFRKFSKKINIFCFSGYGHRGVVIGAGDKVWFGCFFGF